MAKSITTFVWLNLTFTSFCEASWSRLSDQAIAFVAGPLFLQDVYPVMEENLYISNNVQIFYCKITNKQKYEINVDKLLASSKV